MCRVALNRGHELVTEADIQQAESSYSEDMLYWLMLEIEDTHAELADALYAFQGSVPVLQPTETLERLIRNGVSVETADDCIRLLLWFGFLGVRDTETEEERYSHNVRFNLRQLTHPIERGRALYVIHPAFRAALVSA